MLWQMIFHQINLIDAFKLSIKMSAVSITIMMVIENTVILINSSQFSNHKMHVHDIMQGYTVMIKAMSLGFLLVLPYNYYQLQNYNKVCH
jgi:hypothetical protein